MTSPVAVPTFFYGLAPTDLPVRRADRYEGGQMSVAMTDLSAADQRAVRRLYALVQEAYERLGRIIEAPTLPAGIADEVAGYPFWSEIVARAREVNSAMSADYSDAVRRVLHDLRGGSLMALVGAAEMLPFSSSLTNDLHRCGYYARDQLKIMRNCLPELDPVAGARDQATRAHSVRLLVEKWSTGVITVESSTRRVRFACTFDGNIAERCLEFSALDRVIYNLVNNAVRHTSDDEIGFWIFPVGDGEAKSVRFVVTNRVTGAHRAKLAALTPYSGSALMIGGRSTTGGGMGLRICAEFVGHAFGVRSVTEVLTKGYAGTLVREDEFVSWFHWPCAA
ncbi:MAG: hypothetical protein NTV51_23825 [Verrucomicrobia bacterium]|nr:hypothetical protein [Verrucomicrobiota bacterium]